MESRQMVCIVCPVGCRMTVTRDDSGAVIVTGNTCKRGEAYAIDEFTAPKRTVTASVAVEGAPVPLLSVKTNRPVPKEKIGEVLQAIRRARAYAPVEIGDIIIADAVGTGADVVATRRIARV